MWWYIFFIILGVLALPGVITFSLIILLFIDEVGVRVFRMRRRWLK